MVAMILTPYLSELGYEEFDSVQVLNSISWRETPDEILFIRPWDYWREIFEYLGCVEFAKSELLKLNSEYNLGLVHDAAFRYHSASLIFFSQAVLDNIAGWLCSYKNITIHKSKIVFHKELFKNKLCEEIPSFQPFFKKYESLINDISNYRNEWIHRMIGGADIYTDKRPDDPEAKFEVMIPIDPTVKKLKGEDYIKRVEELNLEYGNWLYTLDEFTLKFGDGTKRFVLDCLEIIMVHEMNK
ncbi:hypothetical protein J7E55_11905 [Bacillus sp. ISL-53]|nr:hypothetical protein [Bacillus sp. ISL-53]